MADFNIRSDSVDVEQIMHHIRARIREKRGVDYTEQQIHEMAKARLERFLDPQGVRSDLLEQFRRARVAEETPLPNYVFEDSTIFESDKGWVRFIRSLFKPILKLFFNPNPLAHALHLQGQLNRQLIEREHRRAEWDALYYEVMHNLVVETTRLGIEVKNMRMRVESVGSRLDFAERRARALEGIVQYRSLAGMDLPAVPQTAPAPQEEPGALPEVQPAANGARRRRRRRRGRRGGGVRPGQAAAVTAEEGSRGGVDAAASTDPPHGDDGDLESPDPEFSDQ
jgi:hypothetical protein